jgi:hypothetical protein
MDERGFSDFDDFNDYTNIAHFNARRPGWLVGDVITEEHRSNFVAVLPDGSQVVTTIEFIPNDRAQ